MVTKKTTAKKKAVAPKKVAEPEIQEPEATPEVKKEEPKVIGSLKGGKQVHQQLGIVRFKTVIGPISKRKLPEHLQRWLTDCGYGTNVYQQPKEWLERHHVDMEKVEELKKFINDNYL